MRSKRRSVRGEVLLDGEQERRRESRMRRIRWWRIGTTLMVLSLIAGLVALYFSPALRVQDVKVEGAQAVRSQDVLDLLDIEGDSMLRVDSASIEAQLKTLPMVYAAEVKREWPQTVRIQITERSAWGYWKSGDNLYPIDVEGVVLSGVTPPEGAMVIEDSRSSISLSAGDRVDTDAVRLTQMLLERAPEALSRSGGAVRYSPDVGLSLETADGYRVVIGDSQNFDYKLALWRSVEEELGVQRLAGHVLDLRFGDRPALMEGGDES